MNIHSRNAYRASPILAVLLSTALLVLPALVIFPELAQAFWPFTSKPASAALPAPLIHDATIGMLAAATNQNPDPIKADARETVISDSALLAEAGPAGTIASVSSSVPSADQISVYVVRDNPDNPDTLSDIAKMHGVSVNTIRWANNLKNDVIRAGQTLIILPVSGIERTIVKDDTLKSLAKKYGADAKEIADYNGLDADASLAVGTTIIIPGGEIPVVAPVRTGTTAVYRGGGGVLIPGYFAHPAPGTRVTQGIHGWNGVDLGGPKGTAVLASADGMVIIAKTNGGWNGGYGNYIVISHANGTQTLYSHLSTVFVQAGQSVVQGQNIGGIGATGKATGPHLHFEVRGAKNPFVK